MIDKTKCKRCYWIIACKQTKKACEQLQRVDFHWEDSPNNT